MGRGLLEIERKLADQVSYYRLKFDLGGVQLSSCERLIGLVQLSTSLEIPRAVFYRILP
jgi:hypothetical protein